MPTILYRPKSIRLDKLVSWPSLEQLEQYGLVMVVGANSFQTHLMHVHLTEGMADILRTRDCELVYVQVLKLNGDAQRCLPGSPRFVVVHVRLRDGTILEEAPPELVALRRRLWIRAVGATILGVAILGWLPTAAAAWLGALATSAATYWFLAARDVPLRRAPAPLDD